MEEIPRLDDETSEPEPEEQCNGVRGKNVTNSPEFEFWMVRNPLFPQPNLLSAEELISDGVLLPLHLVSQQPDSNIINSKEEEPGAEAVSEPSGAESVAVSSTSKRWRDIFIRKSCTVAGEEDKEKNKEKEKGKGKKKKERKSSNGNNGGVSSAAELNINIWPFSRSWSAGTGGNRSRIGLNRKVSSAPCSRSNSSGESKSRKWPNSPSRSGGIHLGRNSPVWQVRRGASGLRNTETVEKVVVIQQQQECPEPESSRPSKNQNQGGGGATSKSKGLNLNVPMCMGYRQQLSCRRDENILVGGSAAGGSDARCSNNAGGTKLFNLRTLFTKKVY